VTRGVAYNLRVSDVHVHSVVFYDMPAVSERHSYISLRGEYANMVHTETYIVRNRDGHVALSMAQHTAELCILS